MIHLHCTQKLFSKLPVDANDTGDSPLSGWHANLITLQRRRRKSGATGHSGSCSHSTAVRHHLQPLGARHAELYEAAAGSPTVV